MIRLCTRLISCLCFSIALTWTALSADILLPKVDLNLVLAIDGSASTRTGIFRQQTEGHATVFQDPEVLARIQSGRHGSIAVSVIVWSNNDTSYRCVDWMRIATLDDAEAFERAARNNCEVIGENTDISEGIAFATLQLENAPFFAERHIIDISTDGGLGGSTEELTAVRAYTLGQGITINALFIPNTLSFETSELQNTRLFQHLKQNVIGGMNSFALETADGNYTEALRRKLLKELVAGLTLPSSFSASTLE